MTQTVNNLPAVQETQVQLLGQEDLLKKEMAIHISGPDNKEYACNAGDWSSIPGSERSPGEEYGNPLWYSCLENPIDVGAWQATVHGVAESDMT